jgi:hypothetical protein
MRRNRQIEMLNGQGRVLLGDKSVPANYVIRVFQEFDGNLPTLKIASGNLDLPDALLASAMTDRKSVELELQDGRKAKIILTNSDGSFQVSGSIA